MKLLSIVFYVFLLNLFSVSFYLSGEIIETNEIKTMISYVNQNSFVFLNVNRTLYAPFNRLADHRWKDYLINRIEEGISDYALRDKLIGHIKHQIDSHVPKKICEEITPRLIDYLQQKHIIVFGITQKQVFNTQVSNLDALINNHLSSLDIHFSKTLRYFYLLPDEHLKRGHFSFEHGVLFTNKQPLGATLISFLKQSNQQPMNVVVVDRSYEALEEAEEVLALAGIPFTGIHYDKIDDVEEFDPTLGTVEFFALINEDKILSDEDAMQMMPTDRSVDYEALLDKYIEDWKEDGSNTLG